ncbi:MAG TPA: hypothetical protein VLA13_00375 [Massilibacterium sp.]|nr:hypothetical protein [Massilibacterium sp.]
MRKGKKLNEYATEVGVFECEECGNEFTVCPNPQPERDHMWKGCLAKECDSYDPKRDFDLFFDDPEKWDELHPEEDVKKERTARWN